MASRRLDFIFGTRGARRAKRDVDAMARSTERLGRNAVRTNNRVGFLSRGLRLLQTRLGFVIILALLLTATLGPPLIAVLALATAALVALGGALIPIVALIAAVKGRFTLLQGVAGTAANELAHAAGMFKWAWEQATAAGADIVMMALAKALVVLTPLLHELEPALTMVAKAMAFAIGVASTGFAAMGPDLARMFEAAVPFIHQLGYFLPALTDALVHLAIAGMPVLIQLLEWLTDFSYWLGPAIDDANRFGHSAGFLHLVGEAGRIVGNVFSWLGNLIANFATILYELYQLNKPLIDAFGVALLGALIAFGKAVDWVSGNMRVMGPILSLIIGYFIALKVVALVTFLFQALVQGFIALSVAGGILSVTLSLLTGPAGLLLMAAALFILISRSQGFRNAMVDAWNWVKRAVMDGVNAIRGPIEWLIDKLKWIIEHSPQNLLRKGLGAIGAKDIPLIGGAFRADGGDVNRGGAYTVGERGPELFVPDRAGTVIPSNEKSGGAWAPVYVTLDGRVVAEAVLRQANKKKAVG